jgi:cytochrome o ubiquinol oxidase subunit 1
MYGGRVRFEVPILWSLGFMVTFVIGGMTGVLLAVPPADFVLHNSLFLVAHFHNVIIGGVLFGAFAGYTYWFPKAFGFKLHDGLGRAAFWCWLIGFYVAFMPLYALGLMGMTCQIAQLIVSIRQREQNRDLSGDPWDGRSLEWATPSPPPVFNFAVMPNVEGEEAYWGIKQRALDDQKLSDEPNYEPIEMPHNSPTGFITAFFSTICGFAMIWHIWWMVILGLVGAYAVFVWFAWRDEEEYEISAEEVARIDRERRRVRTELLPTYRTWS